MSVLEPGSRGVWCGAHPRRHSRAGLWFPTAMLLLLPLFACSEGPTGTEPEITDTISTKLAVDRGEVGVVVDVRDIFRKGYTAATVAIAFPDHPDFDATLDVNSTTSLAILRIHNDSLTQAEKAAFAIGVAADMVVYGAGGTELANRSEPSLVLDDSGIPLSIGTALPPVQALLALRSGVPYLLQPENPPPCLDGSFKDFFCVEDGVLVWFSEIERSDVCGEEPPYCRWGTESYSPDNEFERPRQQFYLTPVEGAPDANSFIIRQLRSGGLYWTMMGDSLDQTSVEANADTFVLEQDQDGWARIRVAQTEKYLVFENHQILAGSLTASDRFRLITDNIDWTVTDRGTTFHQPISPPAQLDFAYAATIKNCSPATVTETIGLTQSRTQTAIVATTESLQLFTGEEGSIGATAVLEYVPSAAGGVGGSVEASLNLGWSSSVTETSSNTVTEESSKTSEVSRTRSIQVPPFTAIEAFDAVRTIKDFRIPFTQVYRFSGTYREDGSPLSGAEIMTYMRLNFVEGVPTAVGAEHVDIGIRGVAKVDQMFEAETQVNELPGACN